MFGLAAIPAIVQLFGFFFMPESPRYLIEKRQYDKARDVLNRIYTSERVAENEMNEIKVAFEEEQKRLQIQGNTFLLLELSRC